MRVAYLAAGAGGMVCGSCLRDNRVAATLIEMGRDVVLLPLYTPLRTDEVDVSAQNPVFFGGVNVYLRQRSALFRMVPRFLSRWLDSRAILERTARWSGNVDPTQLGELTVSVLEGVHGRQRREFETLTTFLREMRPAVIHLPNLPFIGIADELRARTGAKIICTLSGEDIFLDELIEPYRSRAFELIRSRAGSVDSFVSVTDYYARHAVAHFGLPADKIHIVPLGIEHEAFEVSAPADEVFTIGYLARICPAKGLANLADALIALRQQGRVCRVRAAGYMSAADRSYLSAIEEKMRRAGVADSFEYCGELTREQKVAFLRSLHVLSVPTEYAEAKGIYVLEALAAGVPVVQPNHGSFPELVAATNGGVTYDPPSGPESVASLARAIAAVMDDPALRTKLGAEGRRIVHESFNHRVMADRTWAVYEKTVAKAGER